MKLEHIKYFVGVAQSNSISAAAKKLYISQSTLSSAISALEAELGYSLLIRSSTGTTLTEEGSKALTLMQDIVEKDAELHNLCKVSGHTVKENICVCIYPCLCSYLSIALSSELLNEQYTGATLSVSDSVGVPDVMDGSIDIMINHCEPDKFSNYRQALENTDYLMEELFKDQLCCYVGSNSALAKREAVFSSELSNAHLVVSQCCIKQHGLKEYHKISRSVTVLNHPDAVKQAVSDGGLIGIAPGCSLIGCAPGEVDRIVRLPIIDLGNDLIVYMVHRRNPTSPEKLVITRIKQLLHLA